MRDLLRNNGVVIHLAALIALLSAGVWAQANPVPVYPSLDPRLPTPPIPRVPDPSDILSSTAPQQARMRPAGITLHELTHIVPKKARKEMEKGERARLDNRYEEAIAHYNEAISLDPEYIAARNNLSVCLIRQGKLPEAATTLEEAVRIDPHSGPLFLNLAVVYELAGNLEAAERAARRTTDLNRGDVTSRVFLGLVLVKRGKYTDEALQCLRKGEDTFPCAHMYSAKIFLEWRDMEKAKMELQAYLASGEQIQRNVASHWIDLIDRESARNDVALSH